MTSNIDKDKDDQIKVLTGYRDQAAETHQSSIEKVEELKEWLAMAEESVKRNERRLAGWQYTLDTTRASLEAEGEIKPFKDQEVVSIVDAFSFGLKPVRALAKVHLDTERGLTGVYDGIPFDYNFYVDAKGMPDARARQVMKTLKMVRT